MTSKTDIRIAMFEAAKEQGITAREVAKQMAESFGWVIDMEIEARNQETLALLNQLSGNVVGHVDMSAAIDAANRKES
jgi:transposase